MNTFRQLVFVCVVVGAGITIWAFFNEQRGQVVSDSPLDPYEVAKNPYFYKGRSGRIDVGSMKFERMVGENLATYEITGAELFSGGEIVVAIDDNVPPSTTRPWHVYVQDPEELTNGFGATIRMAAIKFQGYADPLSAAPTVQRPSPVLPLPSEQTPVQEPPAETQLPTLPDAPAAADKFREDDSQSSRPAPIERRAPSTPKATETNSEPADGTQTNSQPQK